MLVSLRAAVAAPVFFSVGLLGMPAEAARPANHLPSTAGGLELATGGQTRAARDMAWAGSPTSAARAWTRLRSETGDAWAAWDPITAVPNRILLEGIATPGVMTSSAEALRVAQAFLERHLDLLAPGTALADFMVASNDLSSGIRTVGFVQTHRGVPVIGGQVSFRFKTDRLVMIASEALPDVAVPTRSTTVTGLAAKGRALRWVERDVPAAHRDARTFDGPFVLPLVDSSGIKYHEVFEVEVDMDAPASRWQVFVDATTGEPIARHQLLRYASASVRFNVPQRGPQSGPRIDAPAPDVYLSHGPEQLVTNATGQLDFQGASADLLTSVSGPLVAVQDVQGEFASDLFTVSDGGSLLWNEQDDEFRDAQLTAFIHASVVKSYVRNVAPDLSWLDGELPVFVNIDDECNAFSDGDSINFFVGSDACENTGRIADVVYHEFGHSVHSQSVLAGVGLFNVSLSEGVSDYLSATITGDPGIGRGFFYDETPLRQIDPDGFEYRWPEDRGEVHDEGRIIGGALWDLRKLLVAKLGTPEGVRQTDRIWYEATRRAVDIPSMYVEALLVDDDDGNLANGTPNVCEINAAFGAHGLFNAGEGAENVTFDASGFEGYLVRLTLALPAFPECPVSAAPQLQWQRRDNPDFGETLGMFPDGRGAYVAPIPEQSPGTVLQYRVQTNYSNGTERSLPDNYVDPFYETFIGEVVPLYCFEDGLDNSDWSFTGSGNTWSFSPEPGSVDPTSSQEGSSQEGDGRWLGQSGDYPPQSNTRATSPRIDTQGFTNVRLQYWRWLTVEDGYFDRARIHANDQVVWSNHASDEDYLATFHHTDKQWRFHDVDLSATVANGSVEVGFELVSDFGLAFGGWNIDNLCVVGFGDPVACGNGRLDAGEQCDDGNQLAGDGCSSACVNESDPGGTTGDSGGDDGGDSDKGDDDGVDPDAPGFEGDGLIPRGCASCSSGPRGGPGPWGGFMAVGLLAWLRRRRA